MAQATVKCHLCGRSFQKPAHEVRQHNFCCVAHARKWNAGRMTEYNRTANPLNKPGGVVSSRRKHREKLSGQGAGKAYRKFYGRHEHRVAAEAMLGRPLRPGEALSSGRGQAEQRSDEFRGVALSGRAYQDPAPRSAREVVQMNISSKGAALLMEMG